MNIIAMTYLSFCQIPTLWLPFHAYTVIEAYHDVIYSWFCLLCGVDQENSWVLPKWRENFCGHNLYLPQRGLQYSRECFSVYFYLKCSLAIGLLGKQTNKKSKRNLKSIMCQILWPGCKVIFFFLVFFVSSVFIEVDLKIFHASGSNQGWVPWLPQFPQHCWGISISQTCTGASFWYPGSYRQLPLTAKACRASWESCFVINNEVGVAVAYISVF
jgi:hypothetical protein